MAMSRIRLCGARLQRPPVRLVAHRSQQDLLALDLDRREQHAGREGLARQPLHRPVEHVPAVAARLLNHLQRALLGLLPLLKLRRVLPGRVREEVCFVARPEHRERRSVDRGEPPKRRCKRHQRIAGFLEQCPEALLADSQRVLCPRTVQLGGKQDRDGDSKCRKQGEQVDDLLSAGGELVRAQERLRPRRPH